LPIDEFDACALFTAAARFQSRLDAEAAGLAHPRNDRLWSELA
jgi:hypothetical protein